MDCGIVSAGLADRASPHTQCQQRSAQCSLTARTAAPNGTPTGTTAESFVLDSQDSDTMSHASDKCNELQDEQHDVTDLLSWYLLQPPRFWPTAGQTAPQATTPMITEILAEPSLAMMTAATEKRTHRQDVPTQNNVMELRRDIEQTTSIPWNTSTPSLERNGHWRSPLDSNILDKDSHKEMLQTKRPTEASARQTAQQDAITEFVHKASLNNVEHDALEMRHPSVDGNTPRELLPQAHFSPDAASAPTGSNASANTSTPASPTRELRTAMQLSAYGDERIVSQLANIVQRITSDMEKMKAWWPTTFQT